MSHVRFGFPTPWRETGDDKGLVALVEDLRCDFCFQEIEIFPIPVVNGTGETLCPECFRAMNGMSIHEAAQSMGIRLLCIAPGEVLIAQGRRYIVVRPLWERMIYKGDEWHLPVRVHLPGRRNETFEVVLRFGPKGYRGLEV